MERIVDVVKVIGKCGLSYRGDKEEAGYSLCDRVRVSGLFWWEDTPIGIEPRHDIEYTCVAQLGRFVGSRWLYKKFV